jgi:hypothetical protein
MGPVGGLACGLGSDARHHCPVTGSDALPEDVAAWPVHVPPPAVLGQVELLLAGIDSPSRVTVHVPVSVGEASAEAGHLVLTDEEGTPLAHLAVENVSADPDGAAARVVGPVGALRPFHAGPFRALRRRPDEVRDELAGSAAVGVVLARPLTAAEERSSPTRRPDVVPVCSSCPASPTPAGRDCRRRSWCGRSAPHCRGSPRRRGPPCWCRWCREPTPLLRVPPSSSTPPGARCSTRTCLIPPDGLRSGPPSTPARAPWRRSSPPTWPPSSAPGGRCAPCAG